MIRWVLLFLVSAFLHADSCREVIMLLDSKGVEENIGRPGRRYLMNKLQSALQEQAAPLLISPSLWQAFLEKRESIRQISKLSGTAEKGALDTYYEINTRLNFWYRFFREKGFDPLHSKQLMISSVNEEYYTKEAIRNANQEFISYEMNATLMSYFTKFNPVEWEGYTSDGTLYLLVPKKYAKKKEEVASETSYWTSKELRIGLKVDHLHPISLEDPAQCYLRNPREYRALVSNVLCDYFITRDDFSLPYSWNVVLSGHGKENIIANLHTEDFRDLLSFFESKISTKCLHYATCYGSGNNIKLAFDEQGPARYSYAIISDCLSDGVSYTFWKMFHFPSLDEELLMPHEVSYNERTGWSLALNYSYQWESFFQSLDQNTFTGDSLSWLTESLPYITTPLLCTTSSLRLPFADKFITVLPDTFYKITDSILQLKGEKPLILGQEVEVVLIESTQINVPLIIENDSRVPRMISLLPGSSSHFIKKLDLETHYGLMSAFCPVEGDSFDRTFLIEELEFPAEGFVLRDYLSADDDRIIVKNVFVTIEKSMLRLFLQAEGGDSYMIVLNILDCIDSGVAYKGIYRLSEECVNLYLQRYEQIKRELFAKSS